MKAVFSRVPRRFAGDLPLWLWRVGLEQVIDVLAALRPDTATTSSQKTETTPVLD